MLCSFLQLCFTDFSLQLSWIIETFCNSWLSASVQDLFKNNLMQDNWFLPFVSSLPVMKKYSNYTIPSKTTKYLLITFLRHLLVSIYI